MKKKLNNEKIVRYTSKALEKAEDLTDWHAVDQIEDSNIDYSDAPELDEAFFSEATVVEPQIKKSLTVRYDPEVIDYFKNVVGKGYQSKMNMVLKTYVQHQLRRGHKGSGSR